MRAIWAIGKRAMMAFPHKNYCLFHAHYCLLPTALYDSPRLVAVVWRNARHRERIRARIRKPVFDGTLHGFPAAIGTVGIEPVDHRGAGEYRDIVAQRECRGIIRHIVLVLG